MTTAIAPPKSNSVADAPATAFSFAASPMQFGEIGDDAETRPFSMNARSADAIDHPYWGRIVHDFDGMTFRKGKCPVDYCHSEWSLIGYADQFSVGDDGLTVAGNLIVLEANDEADQLFRRGKAGMPYEASIDWVDQSTEIEWIPEDVSTEVNGQQFVGPGYVVRKWTLRSVAVCPYGADSSTSTQFSKSEADAVSVRVFTEASSKESPMPEATKTETETPEKSDDQQFAETPATAPAKTSAVPAGVITPETLKQFSDSFGPKAMEYLTAGLNFDAARLQFAEHRATEAEAEAKQFSDQLAAKDVELKAATDKLKQFGEGLGGETPLEGGADGGESKTGKAQLFSGGKAVRGKQ